MIVCRHRHDWRKPNLIIAGRFFLSPATWRGVHWWVNLSPSPYLDLTAVIRALRGSVGGWGGRGLLGQVLVMLLYRRLGGICGKIERLCQRFQAGRLWRMPARVVLPEVAGADGRKRALAVDAWPRSFAWLVRLAGYQAAGFGSQLRVILGQPEMVALLEASPQAGRILRPMCRMLGVETALLRPGVAAVVVVPRVSVVTVRVRRAPVPVDWGRIPLPRGVLSAARRQGFGKVPRG